MRFVSFILFCLSSIALADTKISSLPLLAGSDVSSIDTVPFVSFSNNETAQLRLSELFNIPSLQSPAFSGDVTATNFVGNLVGNVTGTASGNTTYTANNHGVVLSSATNVMSVLAPNSSTAFALVSGGASANPSWALLSVAGGGTGASTLTNHGVLLGQATSAVTAVATGTSGQVLTSGGASADPAMATVPGNTTILKVPTVQKFTSSSGTYTLPTSPSPIYIRVRMVGGGGGGSGAGTASTGVGGNGGNTTFGTTLLVANSGTGGDVLNTVGTGGSASLGSGPVGVAYTGASGIAGGFAGVTTVNADGGSGGATPFAGGGAGKSTTGGAAVTNSGAGGGGGGAGGNVGGMFAGAGGGAGGFVDAIITSPASTYSYAVGSGGSAGTIGTSGSAGGAGAAGIIIVEEFYQ